MNIYIFRLFYFGDINMQRFRDDPLADTFDLDYAKTPENFLWLK